MDARFPERWLLDRRFTKLTDRQFRTFVLTLTWSVSNRTDGVIEQDDFAVIPGANVEDAKALHAAGLWEIVPGRPAYKITDFADTQSSKSELDVLDNMRRRNREQKARQRARKHGPDSPPDGDTTRAPDVQPVPPVVQPEHPVPTDSTVSPGTSPGTRPPGQHRIGEARLGEDRQQLGEGSFDDEISFDPATGEVLSGDGWPDESDCRHCGADLSAAGSRRFRPGFRCFKCEHLADGSELSSASDRWSA